MTVKSPFYNKPSTLTSVDSCHKCPFIPKTTAIYSQSSHHYHHQDFEQQPQQSTCSNNNSNAIEPCNSSVAKSDNGTQVITSCSNCGTTTTPLWRRSPIGETICNACGLYYKARNTTRPVWLKRNTSTKRKSNPITLAPRISPLIAPKLVVIQKPQPQPQQQQQQQKSENTSSNLTCANCQTINTPLWRRDELGQPICNACGLYYKLHSVHRPITMKRSTIKRRKRVTAATMVTQKPIMIQAPVLTRPLLPSMSPPPYLPSPPMKSIACLLNPEVEQQDRNLPSLPSPPLMPTDDILFASSSSKEMMSQQVLEAHRNELKREVNNLTTLLTRTTAMLQNIDHVMSEIK